MVNLIENGIEHRCADELPHIHDLSKHGDNKTTWNPENSAEIDAARTTFRTLKEKGYSAFKVDREGKPSGPMTEFDPQAGAIIMTPRHVGG